MFRAVRCTTALLAVLAASACGTSPTGPAPARKAPALTAPDPQVSAECDPQTGEGCSCEWKESMPWWC